MTFRTDQVLALRLRNYQVMSILLDELQAGRDAQPGEASLIMRYALWLASCARESSAAQKTAHRPIYRRRVQYIESKTCMVEETCARGKVCAHERKNA